MNRLIDDDIPISPVQKLPDRNLFASERSTVLPLVEERLKWNLLLAGTAAGSFLFAIVFAKQLPTWAKTVFLATSTGFSTALTVSLWQQVGDRANRIARNILNAEDAQLKLEMASVIARERVLQDIHNKQWLLDIALRLPPGQREYYIKYLGLDGMIPPKPAPVIEPPPRLVPQITGEQSTIAEAATLDDSHVSYGWLTKEFNLASKGVLGEKGSGKSYYLAWEAYQFVLENPDGELRIIDLHYDEQDAVDVSQFDKDRSLWLLGVPAQVVKDCYVVSLQGDSRGKSKGKEGFKRLTLAMFRRAYRIMEDREQRGDKKSPYFKLICDEFVGTLGMFSDKEKEEIGFIVEQVQFRGRKFHVEFTLGLHAMKKNQTGIDSTALMGNMDLLFLGTALGDPTTPFPVDIADSRTKTIQAMQAMQSLLDEGQGFACAVRRKGQQMKVEVIPHIHPQDIWFSYVPEQAGFSEVLADDQNSTGASTATTSGSKKSTDKNEGRQPRNLDRSNDARALFEALKKWYRSLPQKPTDEELERKYQELSGNSDQLSERALTYLRAKLEE